LQLSLEHQAVLLLGLLQLLLLRLHLPLLLLPLLLLLPRVHDES